MSAASLARNSVGDSLSTAGAPGAVRFREYKTCPSESMDRRSSDRQGRAQ